MAKEVVQRKVTRNFWTNEKVGKLFDLLCFKAMKPEVDWQKFREWDKKGIFAKFTDKHLAVVCNHRNKKGEGVLQVFKEKVK